MANTKKFAVKNGLQTQNVDFVSPNEANTIQISMLDTDTLSVSGNSGQLFSITDSLTGTIFAVNDISGVPSIEVDDDGTIRFAETFGNVLIGTSTDDGVNKLQVAGNISVTGTIDGRDLSVDGAKLDGIAAGAEVNQNAFSNVVVSGQTTVAADSKTDTLTLIAGTNVTITTDAVNDSITISANDTSVDWSEVQNKPDPVVTVTLTGDVTGSGNATLTDLASGAISFATTIAPNSVVLGTDTTGNYVASITNGLYLTGANGGSEGAALTLAVDATSANTASKVVARDASGNFSAGTITAALTGNADTASTWQTARTLTIGNTGKSVNGSANVSWSRSEIGVPYSTTTTNVNIENTESCVGYVTNSLFGVTDGALYSHVYSDLWKHQIQGDYRTGQIAIRGKNNGTWQSWRTVLDSGNYNSYAPTLTGTGASGTWGISVSGNAATATKLATARSISLTGDVTGSVSFDGSANVSITATVVDDSHNHIISNVDGLQAALDLKVSKDSIVGTVSQSGGIPTGAVVERGSNANGEYVRFADGTQICTILKSGMELNITATINSIFYEPIAFGNYAYPAAFSDQLPKISFSCWVGNGLVQYTPANTGSLTITPLGYFSAPSAQAPALVGFFHIIAIGRWY